MKKVIALLILIAVLGVAGAYFLANKNKESGEENFETTNFNFNTRRLSENRVAGEIVLVDKDKITIKFPDESTQTFLTNTETNISKVFVISASDLEIESEITVIGSSNEDGSITAETIYSGPGLPIRGFRSFDSTETVNRQNTRPRNFQDLENLSPEERARVREEFLDQRRSGQGRDSFGFGSGFVVGRILKITDQEVTVALEEAGSRLVFYSDITQFLESTNVSTKDLSMGSQIIIMSGSEGEIPVAVSIQILD